MFRALCRSSSGTSTVFAASGLHTLVQTARGAVRRHHGRSPQAYVKPEAANTVEIPDDERHNARNMLNY